MIYKESIQLNQKNRTISLKNWQRNWTEVSPKTTSNQQVHEKELNMHWSSRKSMSKPQWSITSQSEYGYYQKREISVGKDMECCGNVN